MKQVSQRDAEVSSLLVPAQGDSQQLLTLPVPKWLQEHKIPQASSHRGTTHTSSPKKLLWELALNLINCQWGRGIFSMSNFFIANLYQKKHWIGPREKNHPADVSRPAADGASLLGANTNNNNPLSSTSQGGPSVLVLFTSNGISGGCGGPRAASHTPTRKRRSLGSTCPRLLKLPATRQWFSEHLLYTCYFIRIRDHLFASLRTFSPLPDSNIRWPPDHRGTKIERRLEGPWQTCRRKSEALRSINLLVENT